MSTKIVDLQCASSDVSTTTQKVKRKTNKKLKGISKLEEKDSSSLTEPEKEKIAKKGLVLKQLEDIDKGIDTTLKSKEKSKGGSKGKSKGKRKSKGKKKSGTSKTNEQLEQEQLDLKLQKARKSYLRKQAHINHYREIEMKKEQKIKQQEEIKQREYFKVVLIRACTVLELDIFNLTEATIKSQYDNLIKIHDPNKKGDDIKIKLINESYEFLTDIIKQSKSR